MVPNRVMGILLFARQLADRQERAIAPLIREMITSRIAPPTPPLAMLPTMAPASRLPPDCAHNPIRCRIVLPRPPPTIPAIELPTTPRLLSCIAAPAMFPPTAPLIRLINRLVRSMIDLLSNRGAGWEEQDGRAGSRWHARVPCVRPPDSAGSATN